MGRLFRDAGMAQVERRAPISVAEGMLVLGWWLRNIRRSKPFLAEEFRLWAMNTGRIPNVTHPNWWGALFMHAQREHLVVKTGIYRSMQATRSHARSTPEYVSAAVYEQWPQVPGEDDDR
jgi:hypothetical protein